MKEENTDNANRRDFYRVTDQAYLQIEALEGHERDIHANELLSRSIPAFEHSRILMQELAMIERDIARVMASVNDRDEPLAAALRLMNRKIDALARTTVINQSQLSQNTVHELSLSQGGLALITPHAWQPRSLVRLNLILLPDYLTLSTTGEALASSPVVGGFLSRFSFTDLSTDQEDLLSRHILKVQQHQLREKR